MNRFLLIAVISFIAISAAGQRLSPTLIPDTILLEKPKMIPAEIDKGVWRSVNRALAGVDESLYKVEYTNSNNQLSGSGSAEIKRLAPISVFGSQSARFSTGNLIQVFAVPRLDGSKQAEFIKLIWTSDALSKPELSAKVAEVNAILSGKN